MPPTRSIRLAVSRRRAIALRLHLARVAKVVVEGAVLLAGNDEVLDGRLSLFVTARQGRPRRRRPHRPGHARGASHRGFLEKRSTRVGIVASHTGPPFLPPRSSKVYCAWPRSANDRSAARSRSTGPARRRRRGSRGTGAGSQCRNGPALGAATRSLRSARWPCR